MPQPWQASRRPEQDARFLANARSLTNSAAGRALDSVGGDVGAALEELVIGQRHPHHVEIALHGREAALNLAAQHTDPVSFVVKGGRSADLRVSAIRPKSTEARSLVKNPNTTCTGAWVKRSTSSETRANLVFSRP